MIHKTSDINTKPVFFLGFGGVGRALALQIVAARSLHLSRNKLRIDIIGIADSAGVYRMPDGLTDVELVQIIECKTRSGKMGVGQQPLDEINPKEQFRAGTIVVDTTATDQTVPFLIAAKKAGCGAVLANKLPLAGDPSWFEAIATDSSRWETTVGAALPVISTVRMMIDSGDEIQRIEGSLSGTLGFIASQLEAGIPFGDAVRDAKGRGYTEPDPRQDLSGLDAARKALILARMLGYRMNMSDVLVESLYPAQMDALSIDGFLRDVDRLNQAMTERAALLMVGGKKLRYAAIVAGGHCSVGLMGVEPASKLGSTRTSDSIVVFTTRQYRDNPLAISGRGAGQEVTASGVLADIVGLSREMA